MLSGSTGIARPVGSSEERGRFLAVAGQVADESYGVYLIDLEKGIITLYQWVPKTRTLRLVAARNCTYDLQLDEYNTEPPPKEIQSLVRETERLGEHESR